MPPETDRGVPLEDVFERLTLSEASATGVVRAAHARRLCAGHFPGDPLLPGASTARLMAGVAGLLVPDDEPGVLLRCIFLVRITPADEIRVSARLEERHPRAADVAAEVHVGGRCAARATFRFGAAA